MHRNNASIKGKEIPEFVAAVESSKADPQTKRAAKLLLYTFVRKQELLAAKQSEFDLEASLLMWGLCRSAPSALRVSFASKSIHAVPALRAYNLKGEP